MKLTPRLAVVAILSIVCAACEHETDIGSVDDGGLSVDVGVVGPDAGRPDAEALDAGEPDASATDAGEPDGGPADAGDGGCVPACGGRQCGPDGCGGSCGDCGAADECRDGTCVVCASLTDAELCQGDQRECGPLTAPDNCTQQSRTVDCGTCAAGQRCNASFRCETCPAESDGDFCQRLAASCGSVTAADSCGLPRTVDCGTCAFPKTCESHQCANCVAATDQALCQTATRECGRLDTTDNCGVTRSIAECGPCPPSDECNASGHCQLCINESDAQLCAAKGVECGTVTLTDHCGVSRTIAECGPCGTGKVCAQTHLCVPANAPMNDTCRGAQPLVFDAAGVATASMDLQQANNDSVGSCVSSGNDVVYSFTLTATRNVTVHATSPGGGAWPAVYVRTTCNSPATDIACSHAQVRGAGVLFELQHLAPGTYYVWVDALSMQNGPVDLTISVSDPPALPANDTCAGAIPLVFGANGMATATADITGATDDYTGDCVTMNGADMVYSFTLTETRDVLARVRRDVDATAFVPAVTVRSTCTSSQAIDQVGCAASDPDVGVSDAIMHSLPPGTYFVIVDSTNATNGPFTLEVSTAAPLHNDTCAGAEPILLNGQSVEVTGDTFYAASDATGVCGAMVGGDMFYSFVLTAESTVTARLSRSAGASSSFHPALYLRRDCTSGLPADEVACALEWGGTGAATVNVGNLGPGKYFLVVDSTTLDTGPFTLDLSVSPLATNETCAIALPIDIDPVTGIGSALGDTATATSDNASSSCASADGGDLVYWFTLASPKNVAVRVTPPPGSQLRPVVSLRTDCAQKSTELGCAFTDTAGAEKEFQVSQLPAGTYYLWIDGRQSFSSGPFRVTVTTTDPPVPPAGDTCADAIPLAFDPVTGRALVTGSTLNSTNDYTSNTAGTCTQATYTNSPDRVFSFALTQRRAVTVTLKTLSGTAYKPVVYLRSSCTDAASEVKCYWDTGSGAIVRSTLNPGYYYVFVDGMNASAGDFSLEVAAYDPPTNDDCSGALPLVFDSSGFARTTGDNCAGTTGSQSAGCVGVGNDVVYSYTLTSEKNVRIRLDPGHTSYGVLYVRSACATQSSELACRRQTGGGINMLDLYKQPAGTYYVWVDGDNLKCGVFDLSVTVTDPPPLARNDTCANAEPIPIDAATGIGTASNTTEAGRNDGDGSCSTGSGGDLAYSFTLTEAKGVEITVTPQTGSALIPVLYMPRECGISASEMGCAKATATATPAKLTFGRLEAGTYTFIVDSAAVVTASAAKYLTAGPFNVEVKVIAPAIPPMANDACASAEALPAFDPVTGRATVTGTTVGATDDSYSMCGQATPLSGTDVAYYFTLANPASVQAKVTRVGTTYQPAVYLRRDCSDRVTELGCAVHASGVGTLAAGLLPAGTYFVVVDGLAATSGGFTLEVTAAPALTNDDCAGAQALSFDAAGFATAAGDSTYATSTSEGTCSGVNVGAPDLVYAIDLAAPKTVTVQVTTSATALRPVVYARRACGDPKTTIACAAAASTASPANLGLPTLAAGRWYLFVDGFTAAGKGAFTLNVTAVDPPAAPLNDTCAGATPLSFDPVTNKATFTGDTSAALDDYAGSCAGTAPDAVYAFTTTVDQKVTATVTGPTGSQPAVYLRSTCTQSDPTAEATCAAGSAGTVTAVANRLPAGTWYVFVDGAAYAGGAYTLEVTLEAPATGPTNDACASAETLSFNGASVQVSGTTLGGRDEAQGSCSMAGAPDAVYSFTTTQAQRITATVTPSSASTTFRPALVLRPTCNDLWRSETGCAAASAAGAAATLTVAGAPAATWYLWVDGGGTAVSSGDYTLLVSLDAPTAPTNDSCASPIPIMLGDVVTGTTSTADNFYGGAGATGGWFGGGCPITRAVASGPELVYSYTPTQSGPFIVTLLPTGYNAVMYVTTACGTDPASCVAYSNAAGNGTAERLVVQGVAGTAYYIFADGAQGAAGPFTLMVQ